MKIVELSSITSVLPRIASPEKMLTNARNLAVMGVALLALSNVPVVEAAFAECFHNCAVVNKMNPVICGLICAVLG